LSILEGYSKRLEMSITHTEQRADNTLETDQLPIAQRRSKRRCSVLSPRPVQEDTDLQNHLTPSKQRSKRVRFSDTNLLSSGATSTGLTPYVRQFTIAIPQRRASTPTSSRLLDDGEVQFTPIRHVLDDRLKRRLRRNGLSEAMNEYETERKTNEHLQKEIELKDAELKRLRTELEAIRNTDAAASSQQVVDEVEAELALLRQSFNEHAMIPEETGDIDWDHVRRCTGPGSDGGDTIPIWEDDADAEALSSNHQFAGGDTDLMEMAVDLEAARCEKDRLFSSSFRSQFSTSNRPDLHFEDSPARHQTTSLSQNFPTPSSDFYQNLSRTLKHATQRAEDAELALHAFEADVKALGFDGETTSQMLSNITAQWRTARLELERLMPGETEAGFEGGKILPEIMTRLTMLVRQVKERDGELKSLREQQRTLRGNFEHALMAGQASNKKVRELEEVLDQGVEEMLEVRMRSQALERENEESSKSAKSLVAALEKYREDVEVLEKLIVRMEEEQDIKLQEARNVGAEMEEKISDLDAQVAAEQTGRRAAEASAVERLRKIKDLEAALLLAQKHSMDVSDQLTALQSALTQQSMQHSTQLDELNTRISNLSTALVSAEAEVDKLKITKAKLEKRVQEETEDAAETVERIQGHFLKGVARANEQKNKFLRRSKIRGANWELQEDDDGGSSITGPMTPASIVRFKDVDMDVDVNKYSEDDHVDGFVEVERGGRRRRGNDQEKERWSRRRRHDSGVGMESLSEDDESIGLMTPELSSEADYGLAQ
jgi:hypothetical protein